MVDPFGKSITILTSCCDIDGPYMDNTLKTLFDDTNNNEKVRIEIVDKWWNEH
jgi:hypothetical protein